MSENSLVASRQDSTSFWAGTGLGEDISDLSEAIGQGSWAQGTMAGIGAAADVASLAFNPVASAIGWVAGWIMDHIPPLPDMLDKLTGDADAVRAGSQTWTNISTHLKTKAADLRADISADMADQVGAAADAWRSQGQVLTGALESLSSLAEGISSGLGVAATLVQVVHDMVRDLIAEAIGMFFQSVLEEVFTLGLATPAVAAQISTWVADKVTKVTRRVNDLISSFQALSKLLNKIQPIVTRLKSVLDQIGSKSDDPAGTGHGPDDAMGQHQTRRHRPELQGHLHPQRRRPVGRRWPSARR